MMMIIIAVGYLWNRLSGSNCRIKTFEYCVNLSIGIIFQQVQTFAFVC